MGSDAIHAADLWRGAGGREHAARADDRDRQRLHGLYRGLARGQGYGRVQSAEADLGSTAVRTANGQTKVLDGPFAETKEQLGGYYLIDVPDLDAALSWAKRCPAAR